MARGWRRRGYRRNWKRRSSGDPITGIAALFVLGILAYAFTHMEQVITFGAIILTLIVIYFAVKNIIKNRDKSKQLYRETYTPTETPSAPNFRISSEDYPNQGQKTTITPYPDEREYQQFANEFEAKKEISYQASHTAYNPEPPVSKLPFYKNPHFITDTELNFYRVLLPIATENDLCVFTKVRFEDLLKLPAEMKKENFATYAHHRGKVRSRHVDFVLCDTEYLKPRLVIELDDWRHKYANRKEVDDYKDQALRDAGLPVLRVKVVGYYNERVLENKVLELIRN